MKSYEKVLGLMIKALRSFFIGMGVLAFTMLVLSFTDLPYYAYHQLGTSQKGLTRDPDLIVILGGSGMPSPDGLIRTYYGASAARKFEKARIVIAHPQDTLIKDPYYQLGLMRRELIQKGVDSIRIMYEPHGFNTYSQAQQVAAMMPDRTSLSVLIVTSPEHMCRAVKTFSKQGFREVSGSSAFSNDLSEEQIENNGQGLGASSLRYNMWSYLQYEIIVAREYLAILYYYLKGWI